MKIKIEDVSNDNLKIYGNMEPIVDYLLRIGFVSDSSILWRPSPDGWICTMRGNINMLKLDQIFEFPPNIFIANNSIYDDGSRSQIMLRPEKI